MLAADYELLRRPPAWETPPVIGIAGQCYALISGQKSLADLFNYMVEEGFVVVSFVNDDGGTCVVLLANLSATVGSTGQVR